MSLRDDLRMYFGGSFVGFRGTDGEPRAMYVSDISYDGDGDQLSSYKLHGTVFKPAGSKGKVVAEPEYGGTSVEGITYFPKSGYYNCNGKVSYVEFTLANRTNRKGLEANRVIVDGQQGAGDTRSIAALFLDQPFPGQLCHSRDWHLDSGNNIHFRGQHVGLVENKQPKLDDQYKYLEAPLCKLLDRFFEQLP